MKKQLLNAVMFGFFVAVFAAIIYRLPINGWGSVVWFIGGGVINLIRAPFARQTKDNVITEKRRQKLDRALPALVVLGGRSYPSFTW